MIALDSCEMLQQNAVEASMRDVVSSNYFHSNFKNMAAARTLVAEFLSAAANFGKSGFGKFLLA